MEEGLRTVLELWINVPPSALVLGCSPGAGSLKTLPLTSIRTGQDFTSISSPPPSINSFVEKESNKRSGGGGI